MKRLWLFLLLPLWICAASVRAEYYTVPAYEVHITITPEGYADIVETITALFSQPRHGIIRAIPYRNIINGKQTDFLIEDLKVDGYSSSTSKENSNLLIKIGDADKYVNGTQIYKIHYRVFNPIIFFDDHSEFQWNVLGNMWDTEIGSFTFTIDLPSQVSLTENDVKWGTGQMGERGAEGVVTVSPSQIKGSTSRVFNPGEGMSIALRFGKDDFVALNDWTLFSKKHGLLLAPLLFLIAGIIAKVFSRNKRQTIMTEFYPPEGISPAIAGGFVDHSVDNNDVLCLIPHLASKGYLTLETKEGGFLQKDDVIFTRVKSPQPELFDFERDFLNGLFSSGDVVHLKSLRDKFYVTMASVKASVSAWIKAQGWYEADQKTMGCVTGLLGLASLGWGAFALFGRQNTDGIALMVTGFILFFLASRFNKRSLLGNETYRKFEGFRQFVAKAERPVIERLMKEDPNYYDKTMAYALAFGYLKQWNKQFDGLLSQPPSWYSGPMMYGTNSMAGFNNFSESFPSQINTIGSAFSSSPSSSSSGGGGGGFSSGGGGGGGGGSSW
jgi:uncharacterized membrane protein